MPDTAEGKAGADDQERCVVIALQPAESKLTASNGKEISFVRAVLTVRNDCGTGVTDLAPNVSLGQESGTVQDVSSALAGTARSLALGGSISWDVFDLLIPAHPGTSSRVHMFGYRAILNWKFDLSASVKYLVAGSSGPSLTPVSRWTLQWSIPDPSTGAVELAIEERKD